MANRKRILIIDSNYPHEKNLYGDVFVHIRAKHYIEHFDLLVVGWNNKDIYKEFVYEGISVKSYTNKKDLTHAVFEYKPDAILIHFVEGWMYKGFIKKINKPVLIWVHGSEALGWYRRIFNFRNVLQFGYYVYLNTIQLILLRQIISFSNETGKVKFVFVSNWMKKITETDTLQTVKYNYIIPNPIDSSIFNYQQKKAEDRKKILLIRSFNSNKYANDIAIEAIVLLSKKNIFSKLSFSIYGVGKMFTKLTDKIKHFPNVTLYNRFIENKNISSIHKNHGIFLCPTRQDAQGVSMCEAMSSGLVPISSYNTAIPEFLVEGVTGFMTHSAQEIADRIEYLYNHPVEFLQISESASVSITSKSGHESVINQEIDIIDNS